MYRHCATIVINCDYCMMFARERIYMHSSMYAPLNCGIRFGEEPFDLVNTLDLINMQYCDGSALEMGHHLCDAC
ncbi:hypothetical protein CHS0354_003680 [Potamilus streckersoni]|uniref:Uncharacterized protein n=1 Tax=Potamilus streckersoni TaxID=2493646 RepID=A0AAE0W1N9_9BIVA|nr:hypothetical protein CHS0354_003680 [Potamilus streckersoni]